MDQNCRGTSRAARGIAVAMAGLLVLNGPAALAASGESSATKVSGVVSIASDPPGANVYLDGQFAGQTPLHVNALANGDHRVRLVKDGYLENGRIVTVNTNNPQNVQVTLTRRSGANAEATAQVSGGGGGGGSKKKWIIIGAAAGGGGLGAALYLTRNKPPVPGAVTVSPTATGMAGVTTFSFTSNASDPNSDTLTYTWDFGDNSGAGSGASPTHVYSTTGTFAVKMSVSDGKESASATGVSVTVARSITSTWTGGTEPGFSCPTSLVLTQTTGTLGGSMQFEGSCSGSIPLASGTVSPLTHPTTIVWTSAVWVATSGTSQFPGLVTTFTGTTDATGNVLTGTIRTTQASSGATNAASTTFRR